MLKDDINKLIKETERIKKDIYLHIEQLPDNKDIKRINKHCFIIKLSQLENNILCPYYYDFKSQYEKILSKIDSLMNKPCSIIPAIQTMINTKYLRLNSNRENYRLNPEVIKQLKQLIKG